MSRDPLRGITTRTTPQSEAADPRQVPNSAGGFTFKVGDEARLYRFLTLGTTGGTYYVNERKLTKQNADVVLAWAQNNGRSLVDHVVEISQAGRAPRNNPALFALAIAASMGDRDTRTYAFGALSKVARTGTHLFTFAEYMTQFRGWGRAATWAFSDWYLSKSPRDAAYQMLKYRQRGSTTVNGKSTPGWRQLDILRSAHPLAEGAYPVHNQLFRWFAGKDADLAELPLVQAFIAAQAATKPAEWVRLIEENRSLTWEMLPDAAKTKAEVWQAFLDQGMPQTALIRQLPTLTRLGVLTPMGSYTRLVVNQLTDAGHLKKARIHPVSILIAMKTYASGRSVKGKSTWQPVREVVDALDEAFYAAFGYIEPAGKRTMLALDVSGSMGQSVSGIDDLSCREASAALALVTAATEPSTMIVGFTSAGGGWMSRDNQLTPLSISPRQRLTDAVKAVSRLSFGGTDCSLPMQWALKNKVEVDTFQIYTDSETWAGSMHPHQALRQYRDKMGISAREAVVGMTATDFTIADPADPGSLDVAGFDANVPSMLANFSRGDL